MPRRTGMAARNQDGFEERLEHAIRTSVSADRAQEGSPEAYGQRVADELFKKAVRTIEEERRQL